MSDIFKTIRWKGESNFDSQRLIARGFGETRQLRTSHYLEIWQQYSESSPSAQSSF
ncbi:MAG: hypothetical protein WDO16_20085 [Bacteroidota bacterium]